jgi:hypothetical protein
MIPYSAQPKVDALYKAFSNVPYRETKSHVLPSSKFELDPLFQSMKQEFINEYIVEEKPFILAGPEFNNL